MLHHTTETQKSQSFLSFLSVLCVSVKKKIINISRRHRPPGY